MTSETTTEIPQAQPREPEDLFAVLDQLGIAHRTHWHEPVFTVAESQSLRDEIAGAHTKNLFLKDKKGQYFLVTLEEDANVDLKQIHTLIGGSGRVSFGKPDALMDLLGVIPGSVTVFAALNDTDGKVKVVLDAPLAESALINGHPLRNNATTTVSSADLMSFLAHTGHEPLVVRVSS
ncbi:prolyl-tRNA synthetase associated domain-containing protein [Pseudohoeflea suaedae]|uniref:Prolyl-tRNA synthetase associated domain-containing protein n=1 Tax=Pseudohoeflea suaedae TaxID=877384 RepID=A0A4R5PMN7_9HYPH|nr:prolyl-tRNA synthetase associated domain-containing protein [Pseudohoeflea suaedae]TDH37767.1 prolyl-tRNA synthetase associated domain-containing protein [Pseudohoeflea suaedae]